MSPDDLRAGGYRLCGTHTPEEMAVINRSVPPGCLLALPELKAIGITDTLRWAKNFGETGQRIQNAMNHGCYLEVITLRTQLSELSLRMFWVVKNPGGRVFEPNDKRTFGQIIADCEKLGFREDLVAKLRAFNSRRNEAIHKFMLGETDYEVLKTVCDSSSGIEFEMIGYVAREIGTPVNNR